MGCWEPILHNISSICMDECVCVDSVGKTCKPNYSKSWFHISNYNDIRENHLTNIHPMEEKGWDFENLMIFFYFRTCMYELICFIKSDITGGWAWKGWRVTNLQSLTSEFSHCPSPPTYLPCPVSSTIMPPKFVNFQSLWRLVLGTSYFGLLSKGEESLFIYYNGAINVSYLYFCFPLLFWETFKTW
jgi:hypothetical protein